MPTPLELQVKELEKAGVQIKKGIRTIKSDKSASMSEKAQDTWLLRWAKHSAQNYPVISRSDGVRFLEGAGANIPAFVVGIGPSLDDNILTLREAFGRAIIIATDASLRPLLAKGIKPDIVISFDCQKDQQTLWSHLPPEAREIPMIANSCTHPDTIKTWPGPLMFFNQWHTKDVFSERLLHYIYPHLGDIPSIGTVGNMGIMLAYKMGCNPIMTAGMDLCYQKRGDGWKYRCQDYIYGKDDRDVWGWWKKENKTLYDNDDRVKRSFDKKIGQTVYRLDPELDNYQEGLAGLTDGLRIKIIDCSAHGLLKEYFRSMTVAQAINEFCTNVLSYGRTTLFHLSKIVKDGRKQWEEDSKNGSRY